MNLKNNNSSKSTNANSNVKRTYGEVSFNPRLRRSGGSFSDNNAYEEYPFQD